MRFEVNAPGHNFYIKNVNSTGTSNLASGAINNGTDSGIIEWTVPEVSSPTTFYYNCQYHSSMSGSISVNPLAAVDVTRPLFDFSSFSGYPAILPNGVSRGQVSISEPYLTYVHEAIARWSNYIKFDPAVHDAIKSTYPNFQGIILNQDCYGVGDDRNGFLLYNDPSDNAIASCGIYSLWNIDGVNDVKYNAAQIVITINSSFQNQLTDEEWVDVLTHELGHGLGIGQLWASWINDLDWTGDGIPDAGAVPPVGFFLDGGAYVNCKEGYKKVTRNGINYAKIPLEDIGGQGTASGHFENNYRSASYASSGGVSYPGIQNELMLGSLVGGGNMRISALTLGALVDFGYQEVNPGNNEGLVNLATGGSSILTGGTLAGGLKKIKLHDCCDTSARPKVFGTVNLK